MTERPIPGKEFLINSFRFAEVPIETWLTTLDSLKTDGAEVIKIPTGAEEFSNSDRVLYSDHASYCSAGIILLPDERVSVLFHYRIIEPNTPKDKLPLLLRTAVPSLGGIRGGALFSKPESEQYYDRFDLKRIIQKIIPDDFVVMVNPMQREVLWSFQRYYDID